jgi:hypothetical protein
MACNSCESTLLIPSCTDALVIGDTEHIETDVYIYLKNNSSGYIYRQEGTTDENGYITLDCTDILEMLQPGIEFEIWVTLRTSNERLELFPTLPYPQVTSYTCFNIEFEKSYNADGECTEQSTYTLEIE